MHAQVHLLSLATAVPTNVLRQEQVRARAPNIFEEPAEVERLLPVFDHAGIAERYACNPIEWYAQPHGWAERNRLYLENAVGLLEEVTRRCLADAGLVAAEIDCIVVASSTGIATPSLDALLIERVGFRCDIERLPLVGLGCAGGILGLGRAASMARARPKSRVLFLSVELCSLWFRRGDVTKTNVIASALFGDGAAGAILSSCGAGPRLGPAGEHTWPHSLDMVGWEVAEDGLLPILSRDIPAWIRRELLPVASSFLERNGLSLDDIEVFVCHPGGAKVLAALEAALRLPKGGLIEARNVLRDHGNMSAPTVLFVLRRMLDKAVQRRMLAIAFGPGFTVGFLIVDSR